MTVLKTGVALLVLAVGGVLMAYDACRDPAYRNPQVYDCGNCSSGVNTCVADPAAPLAYNKYCESPTHVAANTYCYETGQVCPGTGVVWSETNCTGSSYGIAQCSYNWRAFAALGTGNCQNQ